MKRIQIRPEVAPFIAASFVVGILSGLGVELVHGSWHVALATGGGAILFLSAYFLYFFRDPDRHPPEDASAIVAGADGTVAAIAELRENQYLKTDCVRISIFLSLFDVHVNRAPIAGKSTFLGYFPGKRFFTFQDKSSDLNQHNKILIEGEHARCLVNQIVGPVCRRVVYWPDHDKAVDVATGEKIGMMKFGSRLDMYFPKQCVAIRIKQGDTVSAGETVLGRVITKNTTSNELAERERCNMSALPDNVEKAWDDREGPIVFTTVDRGGTPNSIYATCVKKWGNDRIVIADNYFDKTRANILAGSKGAILFITKAKKAYQLKGSIDYQGNGEIFDDMKKWLDPKFPGNAAAVLTIEEAYSGADRLL